MDLVLLEIRLGSLVCYDFKLMYVVNYQIAY